MLAAYCVTNQPTNEHDNGCWNPSTNPSREVRLTLRTRNPYKIKLLTLVLYEVTGLTGWTACLGGGLHKV